MLYLGMGWLGVLVAAPLIARLDADGLAWLMAGAVLYSARHGVLPQPPRLAPCARHLAPVRAGRHGEPLRHGRPLRAVARTGFMPIARDG